MMRLVLERRRQCDTFRHVKAPEHFDGLVIKRSYQIAFVIHYKRGWNYPKLFFEDNGKMGQGFKTEFNKYPKASGLDFAQENRPLVGAFLLISGLVSP